MTKRVEICPCCGQKVVTYKQSFNKILLQCLRHLEKAGGISNLRSLFDNGDMTTSEYANFQKLKYFSLVVKDNKDPSIYILTLKARRFLSGKGTCPKWVKTRQNKVVEAGPEVFIKDITDAIQTKEDWQKQASVSASSKD